MPGNEKRCYSSTEYPLSARGEKQARQLRSWAQERGISLIAASPSERCVKTAELMSDGKIEIITDEALREVSVGRWEGLSFAEIRERWPELYEARGENMSSVAPPGGESFLRASERFDDALKSIMESNDGNIAIVSHSGVIRGWLHHYGGHDEDMFSIPVPCASIASLMCDGNTINRAIAGTRAVLTPGDDEIEEYYRRCKTPEEVIAHCRAVAHGAERIVEQGEISCNRELLRAACLLHDMCRADGKSHPESAAHILTMDAYPALASIVAGHHDLPRRASTETDLLYLSDKLYSGAQRVTIDERFARSRAKCKDEEALKKWSQRYAAVRGIVERYHLEGQL